MSLSDDIYKKEVGRCGLKPHKCVENILKYKKHGKVLDIGVGHGRDALFLAEKGFEVTGLDKSIKKFKELAKKNNLKVKGILQDINKIKFEKKYDVIISCATLNFLTEKKAIETIEKIKKNTKEKGLNVILVFNEKENSDFTYLFKFKELKKLYSNWNILQYREFISSIEKHGEGKLHRHSISEIIAQKK